MPFDDYTNKKKQNVPTIYTLGHNSLACCWSRCTEEVHRAGLERSWLAFVAPSLSPQGERRSSALPLVRLLEHQHGLHLWPFRRRVDDNPHWSWRQAACSVHKLRIVTGSFFTGTRTHTSLNSLLYSGLPLPSDVSTHAHKVVVQRGETNVKHGGKTKENYTLQKSELYIARKTRENKKMIKRKKKNNYCTQPAAEH